jgi:ABC-type Fe3+-hydroxamate transport system substrate-binding protein
VLVAACGAGGDQAPATSPPAAGGGATVARPVFPLTVTDATGKAYTFDRAPKLGCLWYGCTEILADLGVPPHAAGVTEEETSKPFYFPAGPPTHRVVDINNPEQWAAAEVDLILTRGPAAPAHDALKAAAPVFYLHGFSSSDLRGADEFIANTRIMGQLTGTPDLAEAAIGRFEQAVARLKEAAPAGTANTTVAVLFGNRDGYFVLTPDQPFCDVIARNGLGTCVNIAPPGGTSAIEVNAEEFLKLNPGWIAVQGFAGSKSPETRTDPVWQQLGAVQAGHVYSAGNRYYCCSLRGLIHSLQEYGHHAFGQGATIPPPGPLPDFDPTKSALLERR